MKMDRQQWGKGRDIFLMQMAWVWTWGWRLIRNLVQSQNVSQFGNVQGLVTGSTGWDGWWWVWLTDLVTILSGWTLRSSRPGQTNRTLDAVTTSRTLRPFLTLEDKDICFNYILKTKNGALYERKKYLQGLPSLQRDLGDPEGQVYQTGQLDQLDQQHLSHQENPVSARKRERWLGKNKKQKPCFVYSGEKDTYFIVLSAHP